MKTLNLDDPKTIKKYDKSGMLEVIEKFPEQCLDAVRIGSSFKVPDEFCREYKFIVCTGLGGSAIGADIVRSYVSDESKAPVFVNRNYTLPNFVGKESLVIAISYSGNTEETLSAYSDAKKRGAKIITITSGGNLKEIASNDGVPAIIIPGGLQPRCALGYSLFPLLILLSKIGVVSGQERHIEEAIGILTKLRDETIGMDIPKEKNIAKAIAGSIYAKFPVIYGAQDHMDCVITRWKGELAENSKTLSSGHVIPEMNHNEIVGWEFPAKTLKDFIAVILRDSGDSTRISLRLDVTKKIIKNAGIETIEVRSAGKSLLGRMLSLIYIGDFMSYYLAVLNGTDPTPVERINYLKKELSRA